MAAPVAGEAAAGTPSERALAALLRKRLGEGSPVPWSLRFPSGLALDLGEGAPVFSLSIVDADGLAALRSLDELRICEAYMEGHLDLDGDLRGAIVLRSHLTDGSLWVSLWRRLEPLLLGRSAAHAKWVQNHYDAQNLQLHFIDREYRTYTPGVFEHEGESLEVASERKLRLVYEGTNLAPGKRVLEVGFGWGPFLRYACRRGVHVTGITLSRHQLAWVEKELIAKENLPAEVLLADFFGFHPREGFDAIVLCGVIEELVDYDGVMQRLAEWLVPGGRAYLDFVAATEDFVLPAFISKYVFQGATSRVYLPKLVEAVTRSPLELVAMYNDRRNYYLTSRHWYERYERDREEIRAAYGERTFRLFRLYLAGNPVMLDDPSHFATAYRLFLERPAR